MRSKGLLVVLVAAAGLFLVGLPLVMAMMLMGETAYEQSSCAPDGDVELVGAQLTSGLDDSQLANASTIITEGYRLGVSDQAIVVSLAVASQESGFLNYANDGRGNDLAPEQEGIERSLELPHEAVGSDHGSLGVFQQQWPWWGSMEELMDTATSTRKFLAALGEIRGWEDMEAGDAAQAVQQSAHPDAYDDDVALAEELLAGASGDTAVEESVYFGSVSTPCTSLGSFGDVVMPLPDTVSYVDAQNFGEFGPHWESTHTGTDFSAGCGSPVLASTAGVVAVRTDQAWSGRWLVEIDAGPEGVVTWYAHMQEVLVGAGDQVAAGQVIGEVGSEGNSFGCHLHFEVRPGGGDPVDPTAWLAENVGDRTGTLPVSDSLEASAVLVTANVAYWLTDDAAAAHIRGLLAEGPDVVVLQEVTTRDVTSIVESAPGSWAVWQPPGSRGGSAIVWDSTEFSAARRGAELGFDGHEYDRWMPWVLLDSGSGTLPVVALHMPTRASSDLQMQAYFRTMTQNYTRLVGELNNAGYPPIVGGDWNHPLDVARATWSPVPVLESLGLTTNWRVGRPCEESVPGGRIDGFAFNPSYLQVVDQGCLDKGPSDHRPVWIVLAANG